MSNEKQVIIDNDGVPFCRSECNCDTCKEMNNANDTWDTFVPSTPLERRMADVINKIMQREFANNREITDNSSDPPLN